MLKNQAISIVGKLREKGYEGYLVGGCVRDLLLGREPADYDVATDAAPDEVMSIFPETYAVGAQFGVVLVPAGPAEGHDFSRAVSGPNSGALAPAGKSSIEVATFRNDGLYSDGRH